MNIQALVVSCDEFLYAQIVEICRQSTEPVFNQHNFFIPNHTHATQNLLQVCEQVKITWSQFWTVGRIKKNMPLAKSASSAHVPVVFTFWTTLAYHRPLFHLFK
jgi:hypothetical protein